MRAPGRGCGFSGLGLGTQAIQVLAILLGLRCQSLAPAEQGDLLGIHARQGPDGLGQLFLISLTSNVLADLLASAGLTEAARWLNR